MNRVHVIGRLTADPECRTGAAGMPVATFRLAIPRINDGDPPVFVNVMSFERLARAVGDHLTKGRRVAVDGRLDHYEWSDASGARHERHSIVADGVDFLDPPASDRTDSTPTPRSA